jgi:NAD(P)-dependent dehydrogenase (short-subunit alcohol dehydrogenase family)
MTMLKEKVALITGAGSGVGRATALVCAKEGARVVVVDLDAGGSEETVRQVQEAGGEAAFIQADVTQSDQTEAAVRRTVEFFGRLDCAFNNAGVVIDELLQLADYSEEAWDTTIAVNLKGVWMGMKYQIPAMLNSGGGAIVNNASVMGVVAGCCCAYVASKHGVLGLTKAGAQQYAAQGIRINAICPGGVETPLMDSLPPEDRKRITAMHPIGRLATPEEIAESVAWLCSDRAEYLCGSVLMVDGGYTIQ